MLQTVKEEWRILHTVKLRKTDRLYLAKELPSKTRCGRKDIITGRRGERRKQLLDDLKEKRK